MANAIRTTPQLAECEPLSLLGAMMTSASLGLEPNTPLAQAHLVPFKNRKKGVTEVQFIIGWRGMIALARRSGAIVNIHADVVYQNDDFSFEYGSGQHLRHKPSGERANPEYAYCYAKLTDGEAFIVLPWPEIIKTRDNSQGYQTAKRYGKLQETPWVKHEHAMAKKTAVRRLFDELPISIEEVSEAIEVDEQRSDFTNFALNPENGVTIDGEFTEDEDGDESAGDPEDGATLDGKAEDEKKPEPKAEPKADAKKKQESKPEPEKYDKPTGTAADMDVPDKYRKVYDELMGSILDGAQVEAAKKYLAPDLDDMKNDVPEFYEAVMADLAAHEAEAEG